MRTYFNIGSTELTAVHSHMMISTHGAYDNILSMDQVSRELYLSLLPVTPRRRRSPSIPEVIRDTL